MIRLIVPTVAVGPLRAAMTCQRCKGKGHWFENIDLSSGGGDHVICPDCPSTFWIGVAGGAIDNRIGPNFGKPLLPVEMRSMLEPCQTCGRVEGFSGFTARCLDCRDGRPLVELVTDCPHGDMCDPSKAPPDLVPCPGFDVLGQVTATGQVVRVVSESQFDGEPQMIHKDEPHPDTGSHFLYWSGRTEFGSSAVVVPLADELTHAVEVQVVT
jgi:hypothetical protein